VLNKEERETLDEQLQRLKEIVQLEVKDDISRTEDQVSHETNASNKQLNLRLLDRYRKREQAIDRFFKKYEGEIKVKLSDFHTMPRYRKSIQRPQ
jgi:RNA polymerase-binding transcription factor DksA